MMSTHTGTGGFTLIEAMIVIGIAALLSGATMSMYINYSSYFSREQAAIDVTYSASRLSAKVREAVLQANSVAANYSFDGTVYTSSTSTLVLELPSVDASGSILTNTYDYVGFYATGTKAYQVIAAGTGSSRSSGTLELSAALSSLNFTYSSATLPSSTWVEVDVQNQKQMRTQTVSAHVTERSYLRNK